MRARAIKLLVYVAVLVLGITWRITNTYSAMPYDQPPNASLSASMPNEVRSTDATDDSDDEDFSLTQVLEAVDEESMDNTLLQAFVRLNTRYVFLPTVTR